MSSLLLWGCQLETVKWQDKRLDKDTGTHMSGGNCWAKRGKSVKRDLSFMLKPCTDEQLKLMAVHMRKFTFTCIWTWAATFLLLHQKKKNHQGRKSTVFICRHKQQQNRLSTFSLPNKTIRTNKLYKLIWQFVIEFNIWK